jgi:hypothetical protein
MLKPPILSNLFFLIRQPLCDGTGCGYSAVTSRVSICGKGEKVSSPCAQLIGHYAVKTYGSNPQMVIIYDHTSILITVKKKRKAIPVTGRGGL